MKKAVIASLAMIASAATLATFALGGAGKFGNVQVDAGTTEYSITFDAESTVEKVDDGVYAIYGTTPSGAKVGVVGFDDSEAYFTFKDASFMFVKLYGDNELEEVGAFEFSVITGFAISFTGGSVFFDGGDTRIDYVVSGQEYKGLSLTPRDYAEFITANNITVSSLTIWYSC